MALGRSHAALGLSRELANTEDRNAYSMFERPHRSLDEKPFVEECSIGGIGKRSGRGAKFSPALLCGAISQMAASRSTAPRREAMPWEDLIMKPAGIAVRGVEAFIDLVVCYVMLYVVAAITGKTIEGGGFNLTGAPFIVGVGREQAHVISPARCGREEGPC